MYDYGKASISHMILFLPFPQKTVFTVDPKKVKSPKPEVKMEVH